MDGLKTSLRKVVFTAFKRKLKDEIKVAQLSGSVSEMSCYHHGESSLNGAIVNMAQTFTGSNNINLLEPKGQFGTRLAGGSDSASERYIFTHLNPLTRHIYVEADDAILDYLDDDGTSVEPVYYAPIIPMIIVNGSKGIGTGFSTDIIPHNPIEIIDYMCGYLKGETELPEVNPYYEGFKGTVTKVTPTKYLIKGCYDIVSEIKVRITELPIGSWTDNYKQDLEHLIDKQNAKPTKGKSGGKQLIIDYTDMSTDTVVDITITLGNGVIDELLMKETDYGCNQLEKILKLYTTKTTTNMHMFDEKEKLRKYENIYEILVHFMGVRKQIYVKRKKYLVDILTYDANIISNKARFIAEILSGSLDLRRKRAEEIKEMLKAKSYYVVDGDQNYRYLVRLPMDSVTQENVEKLMKEKNKIIDTLEKLKKTKETDIWLSELGELRKQYHIYRERRIKENASDIGSKKKKKLKVKT